MTDRIVLMLMIGAGLALGYVLLRRWGLARAGRVARTEPLLAGVQAGLPVVLYFSSPECAPCRLQQRPALDQLLADPGLAVQVVEVNTLEQPDTARRWGVLSVPATIVFDHAGRPHEVNYGVAGVSKLRAQVERVA